MSFKFEKLKAWQKSVDLAADVHELTKTFPKDELFILSAQIKRAADSVSLNIAEGSTGQSNAEFNKFLCYALRSNADLSVVYIWPKNATIAFPKLLLKYMLNVKKF